MKAKKWNTRTLRAGTYATLIAIAVIVLVIVVNLVVSKLPSHWTKIDTSTNKMYSITQLTEDFVKNVTEEVTIYHIYETGFEDGNITELLYRYESLSDKVKVEHVDPVLRPDFISKYTDTNPSSNSLILESARRFTIVDYYEMYTYSDWDSAYMQYMYYGELPSPDVFDAENQITSGIDYVTSESIPVLYQLQGHGEKALNSSITAYLDSDNIDLKELNLLSSGSDIGDGTLVLPGVGTLEQEQVLQVPEDATCVFINLPTVDLSEQEMESLKSYVDGGGTLIIITGYTGTDVELPNLKTLGTYCGIDAGDGLVIEGNANRCYGYPYWLLPTISSSNISSYLSSTNINILLPFSSPLKISENTRDSLTVSSLLVTSNSAYCKTGTIEHFTKEEGDEEGTFYLGLLSEDSETGGKMVWFSSPCIVDSSVDTYASGGNSSFFMATVGYLCQRESSLSISSISLAYSSLVVSEMQANIWGIGIFILLIPVGTVLTGLVIWLKRRKR